MASDGSLPPRTVASSLRFFDMHQGEQGRRRGRVEQLRVVDEQHRSGGGTAGPQVQLGGHLLDDQRGMDVGQVGGQQTGRAPNGMVPLAAVANTRATGAVGS